MTDAQGRFKFDADTAAYNARMDEAKRKAVDVARGWASAVPVIGQLTSGVGLLAAGVGVVQAKWDAWLQRLTAANQVAQQLVEKLAGAAGGAGMLDRLPELRSAIEAAGGRLSVDQRVAAFGQFTDAYAGATPDQAVEAVRQSQQAAMVIGPEGVPAFVQALATAMDAGMNQAEAGDLALVTAQAGPAGAAALEKAAGQFIERMGAGGGGASFRDFLAASGADVWGAKGIRGGLALQRGMAGMDGALARGAAEASTVDPVLGRSQRLDELANRSQVLNGQLIGDRGRIIADLDRVAAAGNLLGGYVRAARRPEETDTWGGSPDGWFARMVYTTDALQALLERELEVLERAQAAAARDAGAAKFRTEAHEEKPQ